ncbi:MAG: group I intron-associated PD-(D/E)XK endonuclease [Chloroflexi bacterium]|nr:group I intron-associated PD-(D/E)XK endonuclease [Chloroflexota bacterium]MCI0647703.1 group I intron-associated PD-(D/E)XK endonuclease [Chloroflexota bacterium]MCI0726568.1 group I intron-associated PD-(D/E)XK endonuclease [Chloroflexota bacterium]
MNKHHTKLKGDIGLAAVIKDLVSKGFFVSIPISENAPFDLIATDIHSYRVQVKTRSTYRGAVEVQFKTSWADKNGVHYSHYGRDDFDVLAIYAIDEDKCLYVENGEGKSVTIRFNLPKNSQTSGVRMWHEFRAFPPSETIRGAPKDQEMVYGEDIVQPASQKSGGHGNMMLEANP